MPKALMFFLAKPSMMSPAKIPNPPRKFAPHAGSPNSGIIISGVTKTTK